MELREVYVPSSGPANGVCNVWHTQAPCAAVSYLCSNTSDFGTPALDSSAHAISRQGCYDCDARRRCHVVHDFGVSPHHVEWASGGRVLPQLCGLERGRSRTGM